MAHKSITSKRWVVNPVSEHVVMDKVEQHPLFTMFNAKDVPIVDVNDANKVSETYFQALALRASGWVPFPIAGQPAFTQIHTCNIDHFPNVLHLVMDMMVRENEVQERFYFDNHLLMADVRNGNYVFIATQPIPIDLVVAMKLVANADPNHVVLPEPEWMKPRTGMV